MKKVLSKHIRLILLVIASSVYSTQASSTPITSTETIFNFDFTSSSPNPPYTNIQFSAVFNAIDPISVGFDSMLTNVYGGLNGTELLQSRNDTLPGFPFNFAFNNNGTIYGALTTANAIFDPMLDGVFSFGLQMITGTADLESFTACGRTNGVISPCSTLPKVSSVPVPATIWLFGTGILGLIGFNKRRKAT